MANSASSSSVPTLGTLARAVGLAPGAGADVPVAGIAVDHRKVQPGYAFFALPGTRVDGASFIPQALAAGAIAVFGVVPPPEKFDRTAFYFRMDDPRGAVSRAAALLHPGQPEHIVAVTGTAGKTSVAEFTRQILAALGRSAASLGTLGVISPEGAEYGSLTTPDPISLHLKLEDLARSGVTHLAMEASSHGIDQRRLDGVRLAAAAFTNLGRDHLDYHPDVESYFAAKMRLFDALLPADAPAVINLDGDRGAEAAVIAMLSGRKVLTVGERGADLTIESAHASGFGQDLVLACGGARHEVHLPLIGGFQVQNACLAAGLAIALGESPTKTIAALGSLAGVPGRLERVGAFNRAPVFVDYAHKPEALEHALRALRPFVTGRLVTVFGCGGDRDPGKRSIMGEIAARLSDVTIVTDDNPRSEEPASIRKAILAAVPEGIEIGDRAEAIREGVERLEPGDALLIAGKGHETGQIVGSETFPFSDHAVARAAIEALT